MSNPSPIIVSELVAIDDQHLLTDIGSPGARPLARTCCTRNHKRFWYVDPLTHEFFYSMDKGVRVIPVNPPQEDQDRLLLYAERWLKELAKA